MRHLFTIGHSNRDIDEFIDLLDNVRVDMLIDVRSSPTSKTHPQFNKEDLRDSLESCGIRYLHIAQLGGHRSLQSHTKVDNNGWENASFRNYADHMQTAEFEKGIHRLIGHAAQSHCAIMCAEILPWRCHRRLVADAMIVKGFKVFDIINSSTPKQRVLTPFAVVRKGVLSYPAMETA